MQAVLASPNLPSRQAVCHNQRTHIGNCTIAHKSTQKADSQQRFSHGVQCFATSAPASAADALPFKLRPGAPGDLPLIAQTVLLEWLNPLGLNPSRFLVATTSGPGGQETVVGWGQLKPLEAGAAGGTVYELATLVTVKQHRGKGVASTVVRALLQRAGTGDRVLLLTTTRTAPFYEKLGFKTTPPGTTLPSMLQFELKIGSVIAPIVTGGQQLVVLEASQGDR